MKNTNPSNDRDLVPMKSKRRRFNRHAKEGLLGLQRLKDDLRSLLPFVPLDREPELFALLEFLDDVSNLILDDQDPDDELRLRAGLNCVHCFPRSLRSDNDQEDADE